MLIMNDFYKIEILKVWGEDYKFVRIDEEHRRERIVVEDTNGVQYSTDVYKFLKMLKKPQASTALDKNKWFISKASSKDYFLNYDYTQVIYLSTKDKIKIKCIKHNKDLFFNS